MKLYMTKKSTAGKTAVLDDMILTKEMPTAAGSRMLEGYTSLFDAAAVERLTEAGYEIGGKANVGEFSIDLLGETSYFGAVTDGAGKLLNASAEILKGGEATVTVNLDVNGMPRRAAAQNGLVFIKPTYGIVSRYGTVPVVCSGETVGVMASSVEECRGALGALICHDERDGTSLPAADCLKAAEGSAEVRRVALVKAMARDLDGTTEARLADFKKMLEKSGVEVVEIDGAELTSARAAWNILMSAELCNNVSRYDGIKYGYRSPSYSGIDELYTNSRTEAFGLLLKTAILFGSDALSSENYDKVYDKALRVRRVISEYFGKLFAEFDAVLLPATSRAEYSEADVREDPYLCFEENLYTAPASITGLPAIAVGGVQLIGPAFSENRLFAIAELYEKEGR
jgi:aspartyl-tRNA(Asn)/glutamyl-tRNA(Gln) amidotransferase subunit A